MKCWFWHSFGAGNTIISRGGHGVDDSFDIVKFGNIHRDGADVEGFPCVQLSNVGSWCAWYSIFWCTGPPSVLTSEVGWAPALALRAPMVELAGNGPFVVLDSVYNLFGREFGAWRNPFGIRFV